MMSFINSMVTTIQLPTEQQNVVDKRPTKSLQMSTKINRRK